MKDAKQVIVYYEKNRFGGWPANNDAWIFSGDELLVGFQEGPYELKEHNHNIGEPSSQWQLYTIIQQKKNFTIFKQQFGILKIRYSTL